MSAAVAAANPQESNTARKKRERAEQAAKNVDTTPGTPSEQPLESSPVLNGTANGDHSSSDSPYIRELQKQVRNITKKLNATAKVDAIIAENPKSSLDDLIASKKINADQRAQISKKPQLQSQLNQLEEQLAQYRKVDTEYQSKLAAERESLNEKFEAQLSEVRASAKKEAEANVKTAVRQKLLLFSQFLRAAAAKRVIEEEADTEESKAFEGALLLVYGGDDKAVEAAENIVDGTDETVPSTEGQPLSIKYSQIKALTLQHAPYASADDYEAVATADAAHETETPQAATDPTSDPTIVNAGLTELGAGSQAQPMTTKTNGDTLPSQISTGNDSANQAAGQSWGANGTSTNEMDALEESFEMVPRDPAETDTPHAAPAAAGVAETGAGIGQSSSWADDSAEAAAAATPVEPPKKEDDGFHEVQGRHHRGGRGGHRGDGEGRGRGRGRGGYRGGDRGERGGRSGFRGERRGGGEGRGRGGRGRGDGSRGGS